MKKINDKSLELKKNQHYVWAWYMKHWSSNDRDVWYTTKNKKIALDSVRGIAVEPYFYKANQLTVDYQVFLEAFIMESYHDEHLQKQHMFYLDEFVRVQKIDDFYRMHHKKKNKIIETAITNALENLHSFHEREVLHILKSLANGDLSVLQADRNMVSFLHFLSHQFFRTKAIKEKVLANCRASGSQSCGLLSDCWWFMGFMLGMGLGKNLFCNMDDDIHCLLINNTDVPFITSDQPVINVHQDLVYDGTPPADDICDLYYPISPMVAYMVNKSDRFSRGKNLVSSEIVDEMNIKIAKQANVHIIANNKEVIKNYQKYVNYHLGSLEK